MPVSATNLSSGYDFYGSGSQQITYSKKIKALKGTQNGLYVFTEDKVEFLGANALQNVAGSATFISTPLGDAAYPISNQCVAAAGDKIFWISQNLQVMTINVTPGVSVSQIGELSARPVVSIKEFLDKLDTTQSYSFAFFNETDKTAQFHVRTVNNPFNDYALVYDMVNDTWNVDTQKQYNTVVKIGFKYYGLSDVNSSVYQDDVGYSDAGMPIEFHIITQNMIQSTYNQKLYGGLFTQGAIGKLTTLDYEANIDNEVIFSDSVTGTTSDIPPLGEIGGDTIGASPIGGDLTYTSDRTPFDLLADEGRIYTAGTRFQVDISSVSQIQDFIIDRVGVRADIHDFVDTGKKW
jgi:hypothetical protein